MRIACHRCQKLVDRTEVERDPIEDTLTIRVHCHGEVDSMTVTAEWQAENQDFVQAINAGILGWAFRDEGTGVAPSEQE